MNRRQFITGLLAGAAVIAVPSTVYAKPPKDKDNGPPPGKGWRKNDAVVSLSRLHAQSVKLIADKGVRLRLAVGHAQTAVIKATGSLAEKLGWSNIGTSYSELNSTWGTI